MKNGSNAPLVYYSYCYNGESEENEYQLKIIKSKDTTGKILYPKNEDLFSSFFQMLLDSKPLFDETEYLEYHYNKCLLPKADFLKETRKMYLDIMDGIISRKGALSLVQTENHKTIMNWFESKQIEVRSHSDKPKIESFADIFAIEDWRKYVEVLTLCTPKLLEMKDGQYTFVGNKKTQKGCIAQWFRYLSMKGTIKQSISKNELVYVLCNEIKDYSISVASIYNESTLYSKFFEKQLTNYLNKVTIP